MAAQRSAAAWSSQARVEADHGSFWAYTRATVLDALDRGWTVHRTIADDLGLRWLPELAGFADLADIANLTFRADEHARILTELSEQLRVLEARVRTLEEPSSTAKA